MTIDGQVALVTGANKGIGKEIARRLAQLGATVFLGSRDLGRGSIAASQLDDAGDVRSLQLDVSDAASVHAAVAAIEHSVGRLDVLINNAGVFLDGGKRPAAISAQDLRNTYEVNVFGVVTMINACLPLLQRSGAGRIVNVSARLGSLGLSATPDHHVAKTRFLAYNSSKAALNALTLLYANELRGHGILVNAAYPGFVATDMNGHRGTLTARDGAAVPVYLATLSPSGPSGQFWGPGEQEGSFEVISW